MESNFDDGYGFALPIDRFPSGLPAWAVEAAKKAGKVWDPSARKFVNK